MAENRIRISTIIPVYNAGKFLERCLDSVLGQNLDESEIICIDDGSTDSSWEIMQSYSRKYDNVHCLRQKNLYAGAARNKGLKAAKGEYVHFLDADDYVFPNIYKDLYDFAVSMGGEYIKFRSKCFSISTGLDRSGERADYTCAYLKQEDFGRIISIEDHPNELIEQSTHVPWAGIYKRSFLLDHKIEFNGLKCVNDRSFYVEIITSTDQIAYWDGYVVNHQIDNPDSLVGCRGDNFECNLLSYCKIKDYLKNIKDNLENNLYKRILSQELGSLFRWYSHMTSEQKETNKEKLYSFFLKLDWSDINKTREMYTAMEEINYSFDEYKSVSVVNYESLPAKMRQYKYTFIYGAGMMARHMIRYLEAEGISISSIVVSSNSVESFLEGKRVYQIDKIHFPEDKSQICIVLSAKSNCHLQMLHKLRLSGIKDIVTISDSDFVKLSKEWKTMF